MVRRIDAKLNGEPDELGVFHSVNLLHGGESLENLV